MHCDLTGRVAIVTGAARGIGLSIAEALAECGASVVISDIDGDAGARSCDELSDKGRKAVFHRADVANESQVAALIEATLAEMGAVDILINNAGVVSTGAIGQVTAAEWRRIFEVDVTSVFLMTRAVLPSMTARRAGRIINIASIAGRQGGGLLGNSCYASAKGAVIAFSKGIAREAGPAGVTCNAICPGLTQTGMTDSMPDERVRRIVEAIPLGRAGTPMDIAGAVAFLASDAAAFINGVTLDIDGGFLRH